MLEREKKRYDRHCSSVCQILFTKWYTMANALLDVVQITQKLTGQIYEIFTVNGTTAKLISMLPSINGKD